MDQIHTEKEHTAHHGDLYVSIITNQNKPDGMVVIRDGRNRIVIALEPRAAFRIAHGLAMAAQRVDEGRELAADMRTRGASETDVSLALARHYEQIALSHDESRGLAAPPR